MERRLRARLVRALCAWAWMLLPLAAVAGSPGPGDVPPDALAEGVTVSQHRGKVVIVTFWASWCGPCRRELPILGKVQKAVGREHLEVIAVNLREPRKEYQAVVRANRDIDLTWVHDARGQAAERYGVTAVPHMFIIDREGKVAHVHRGYSDAMIDGFVKEMLALLPPEVLARPAGG